MGIQNIEYSIIIPHKNLPDLLRKLLDSIPIRDDLEIIIVDDYSDSDKVDFDNFPGKNRKDAIILSNKNGNGAGGARNTGVEYARGKWILFADSDDTYTADLNIFLDEIRYSDKDVIYFKSNLIGNEKSKEVTLYMNYFINNFLTDNGSIKDIKFGAWEPWNKAIKRKHILKHKLKFDEISSANDKMFSLKLGEITDNNKIGVSDRVVYNYILRPGSTIHGKRKEKFLNSFNTILRQNSLYHRVKYKRKVFIPFFLFMNRQYLTKDIFKKYFSYLRRNRTTPFEGLVREWLFHVYHKYIK